MDTSRHADVLIVGARPTSLVVALWPTHSSARGGDRLPWTRVSANRADFDFAALTSLDWQRHVYGEAAPPDLPAICEDRRIPLHVFA